MKNLQNTIHSENKKCDLKNAQEISNPLENVKLDSQQTTGVLMDATTGLIASNIPVFCKIFEWIERVERASREEKLNVLLAEYAARFDSFEDSISKLKIFTATRGGQTLFRKIIQILDKGEEDKEWICLLAIALKKILETEFEKYFDKQIFILSQIDRLSPQALILLSKYGIWRELKVQGTTTMSGQTTGDWIPQATMFIRQKMSINNLEVGARVNHSFRELESVGMVDLRGDQLKLTAIGLEIYKTIDLD